MKDFWKAFKMGMGIACGMLAFQFAYGVIAFIIFSLFRR